MTTAKPPVAGSSPAWGTTASPAEPRAGAREAGAYGAGTHPPAPSGRGRAKSGRRPWNTARAGAPTAPVEVGAVLVTMPIAVSAPQQH